MRSRRLPRISTRRGRARGSMRRLGQRCVFVLAGGAVGPAARTQFQFSQLEMLLEVLPFLIGGLAVFRFRSGCSPLVEEPAVGADQFVLEDREVGLDGGDTVVAEELGGDVDGQSAGDGFGGEQIRRKSCGV